ncbi:MAG: cytochrome C oxidase subunit IV family protein [Oscillochloridaceae bacterium umkhey_bin13]
MAETHAHDHGKVHDGHAHGHISESTYYKVFAALMVLMGLTVGAYWLEGMFAIPRLLGVTIALAIAMTKTVLIVVYFMHLKVSSRMSQLYAVASVVGLLFMFIIIMGDYLARGWPPQPGPLP